MHNKKLKNLLNIQGKERNPSNYTRIKTTLYKKQSTKNFLLFLKFFNSVLNINKMLIMFNLNLLNFIKFNNYNKNFKHKNKHITNIYFLNTNQNTNINILPSVLKKKKKLKKLHKYRHFFVNPFSYYMSKMLKKSCKMIIKFNFFKLLKIWFININKINFKIINFNNIYIYCKEIYNCIFYFLNYTSSIYFFKLNNLTNFIKYRFKKLKNQKRGIIYFLHNLKQHFNKNNFDNMQLLIKIIKYIIDNVFNKANKKYIHSLFFFDLNNTYINNINYIKKKYIKKMNYLFKVYTASNIILKNYWNFSFILKTKKKRKKVKQKQQLDNQYNFIHIFNVLINKYMFFIFIYWINSFFNVCMQSTNNIISNFNNIKLFIFNNNIKLYYEKPKYRSRFKKLPKWCFLSYYKPSVFILYLNNLQ